MPLPPTLPNLQLRVSLLGVWSCEGGLLGELLKVEHERLMTSCVGRLLCYYRRVLIGFSSRSKGITSYLSGFTSYSKVFTGYLSGVY